MKDWPIKKLGDICKTSSGGTPLKSNKQYYLGGTIPWLLSGEVSQGEIFGATNFITEKALKESSAKLFPKNTVLIAMYGATAGEVGILRFESATNQAVCGILPNGKLTPEFLYYFFLSKKVELVSQAVGNAQPNISQQKIRNTFIPIPSLAQQERIATTLKASLSKIEKVESNSEQNLKNVGELLDSHLHKLFDRNREKWERKSLSEISENLDSKRVPITQSLRQPGSIPYYGASGIVDYVRDCLFDENLLCVSEDGANLLARTYPIAFSISGKSWVNNHAHVLRFKNVINQKFVELYLNSIKLDDFVSGMAQPKLNQAMLNKIPIPYPSLEEQGAIVDEFDQLKINVNKLRDIYQRKLNALEELKKSILQKAFRGELTSSKPIPA